MTLWLKMSPGHEAASRRIHAFHPKVVVRVLEASSNVPPKLWYILTSSHGVTAQNTSIENRFIYCTLCQIFYGHQIKEKLLIYDNYNLSFNMIRVCRMPEKI